MNDRPAGLYLHIPFCSRVCPYCDFAVRTGDAARRRRFVDHLAAEVALYGDSPLRFDTIYFGGGTPSLLEPADLQRILDAVRTHLRLVLGHRIFLEANPEDATPEAMTAWRRLGVRTLSLGIQAFEPAALAFLGRRHDADEATRAVELAHEAGFDTISVDLIYGLPGQTAGGWRRELDRALALGVHHLSCYQLTVHERTRFGLLRKRGQLFEMPNDTQAELFRLTHSHLNERGLNGYEVSQFAAGHDHRSRHNVKYWDHTPYLGLGPAAHSFHGRRRWWNVRRTDAYQERVEAGRRPVDASESLGTEALVLEALMTGLRTYSGVDLGLVRTLWNVDLLAANRELLDRLAERRLIALEGDRVVPTLDGLAVADTLTAQFEIPS